MTSHSQNGESAIVLRYFNGRRGNILDIGAYDGVIFSNSYDLISIGWKGTFLEPHPEAYDALHKNYKDFQDVRFYNIGIDEVSGEKTFYKAGLSSTIYENLKRDGEHYLQIIANFLTWADFEKKVGKQKYNFISIDAEGSDYSILRQMDLKELGCECICIEHNSDKDVLKFMESYCNDFGMKRIAFNAENIILAS